MNRTIRAVPAERLVEETLKMREQRRQRDRIKVEIRPLSRWDQLIPV